MSRLGKKIAAFVLAATVAVSTVTSAFAVGSPVKGNSDSSSTVSGTVTSDTTVTITDVTSTSDTATIPSSITSGGKTYNVDVIATNTIKKKYTTVTIVMNSTTTVQPKVTGTKDARKTKKIIITSANGQKLTAKQFSKKAFKKCKAKIIIKKSAMSKKQFKKLKKRLKKGGFKGKLKYKA